ncbi:MAG: AtpZ/AtpI family protein [Chitinophagales bacterium]|nr:AtpZ/AtpI family protein [Chitinophagales bacterium]
MDSKGKREHPASNNAMRYSAIGFQIMGIFALGVFIGYKVDKWLKTDKPYFMLLFALVFAFAGLYLGLKDFLRATNTRK